MEVERPQDRLRSRVEGIITGLMRDLEKSIEAKLPNGVLPKDVTDWWTMHYRSKFYYALDYKQVKHDDKAKTALKAAALELGAALLKEAGGNPVTWEHAAHASVEVDCKPDSPTILVDWCN